MNTDNNSTEEKLRRILLEAMKDEGDEFYEELDSTKVNNDYLNNLLKNRKSRKWWAKLFRGKLR